jgi:NADH-quinone oxidoreductase subunit L
LALIMIITTSGLPPFAAFFSKGLVIESVMETGTLLQVIIVFATTALTFAYSLRFLKLVFLGKESEHLQKLHVHEAPKIMLAPAFVLAIACIVWGLLMPWLGGFMGAAAELSFLGAFVSLETGIYALLMVLVGAAIYTVYWKRTAILSTISSDKNPLARLLNHGYYVDAFYENGITKGILATCSGLKKVEVVVIEDIPIVVANGVMRFAGGVYKYIDRAADQLLIIVAGRSVEGASKVRGIDTAADRLLDIIGRRTVRASKVKRQPVSSLQHYLAAALIGFIMLVILIIISVRGL